jgi:hypothetical protein
LATVRIYKVAELLDTTSQEVLALLKRDHGIELKSASSTLEEVVARSFVERVARQRNIALPGGDMFAEHHHAPAKTGPGKKPTLVKKAEPPKPAAPQLGPPRLVKTVKPAAHPEDGVAAVAPHPVEQVEAAPPFFEEVPDVEPEPAEAPVVEARPIEPVVEAPPPAPAPIEEEAPAEPIAAAPAEFAESEPASSAPSAASGFKS